MAEVDWNQFTKQELVEILDALHEQAWVVERFDTERDTYLGQVCSCDVGPSQLPQRLVDVIQLAAHRRSPGPLEKLLRNTPASQVPGSSLQRRELLTNALTPTNLYRRIALATGLTAAELPPALLSVLDGRDVSHVNVEHAEADLADLLDEDNLDHLDIIHDFRDMFLRVDPENRTATG